MNPLKFFKGYTKKTNSTFDKIYYFFFPIFANVVILLLAAYVFLIPGQAIDFFQALSYLPFYCLEIWSFILALFLLGLSLWYSSIHSYLRLDSLKRGKMPKIEIVYNVSLFLGFAPFTIGTLGFLIEHNKKPAYAIFMFLAGILIWSFLYWMIKKWDLHKSFESKPEKHKKILKAARLVMLALLILMIFLTIFFEAFLIDLSQFLSAQVIIGCYLSCLVLLLLLFRYFRSVYLTALTVFLILIAWLFSYFNNNHDVQVVSLKEQPITLNENFISWKEDRFAAEKWNKYKQLPIILVIAEGGGVRAMNWTALALDKINRLIPEFNNYVYAISGVSGGSVGATYYNAYLNESKPHQLDSNSFREILSKDYLSPVTFGFLVPDIMQSFVPVPVKKWDRSRWLENAFAREYLYSSQFNESIYDLYKKGNTLPNLFLNATVVETGQKAIISNLLLDPNYFSNVIDVSALLAKDKLAIPVKTAGSISARFPFITSVAKIGIDKDKRKRFNLVDGGYYDNSGLETALQLLLFINEQLSKEEKEKAQVHILFLKNNINPYYEPRANQDVFIDLFSPISASVNAMSQETKDKLIAAEDWFKHLQLKTTIHTLSLNYEVYYNTKTKRAVSNPEKGNPIILPLGWSISKLAKEEIHRQIDAFSDKTLQLDKDWNSLENQRVIKILKRHIPNK